MNLFTRKPENNLWLFYVQFELLVANAIIFREKNKNRQAEPPPLPFAIHSEFQQLLNKIKITTSYYFGGDGEWHLKYILTFTNSRVLSLIEALNIENTAVANIVRCGCFYCRTENDKNRVTFAIAFVAYVRNIYTNIFYNVRHKMLRLEGMFPDFFRINLNKITKQCVVYRWCLFL